MLHLSCWSIDNLPTDNAVYYKKLCVESYDETMQYGYLLVEDATNSALSIQQAKLYR